VELLVVDDRYQADLTQALVGQMLAGQLLDDDAAPFAVTTLGYPATEAVHADLNKACIPQPFVVSNHPAWGDPEGFPWTTGLQLSHATEALIWAEWIEANLAEDLPVRVAALFSDDAFGQAYESAFRSWADAHPEVVAEFVAVGYEPFQEVPSITSELTTIRAAKPDVFLAMTAGSYCGLAVAEAASVGLTESTSARFTSTVCRDPAQYLVPAGDAADGWRIVFGGVESTTDPAMADNPFVGFANERLRAAGLEPAIGFYGAGFALYGWAHIEALRIAAELDGGISRTNFLLAMRSLDLEHPMVTDGVRFATAGGSDAFAVEGSQIGVFSAAEGTWSAEAEIVDVDGATPPCRWDDGC
jgi:branched-chain amino acid transport system substrate-binding protein